MKPTAYWIPHKSPGRIALVARPRGDDWLLDELKGLKETGFDLLVSLLTHEENIELRLELESTLAEQQGLTFISFAIKDYDVPASSSDFALLVDHLDDQLTRGRSIAIHCRQSIGRSSVLAASLLAISNENVDECFRVIAEARGTVVPDTLEQRAWVRKFAREFIPQTQNR